VFRVLGDRRVGVANIVRIAVAVQVNDLWVAGMGAAQDGRLVIVADGGEDTKQRQCFQQDEVEVGG